jgi:outer membrane protein TolC
MPMSVTARRSSIPTISLTESVGARQRRLTDRSKGDSVIWSIGANLFQAIFNRRTIRGNYDAARPRFDRSERSAE